MRLFEEVIVKSCLTYLEKEHQIHPYKIFDISKYMEPGILTRIVPSVAVYG